MPRIVVRKSMLRPRTAALVRRTAISGSGSLSRAKIGAMIDADFFDGRQRVEHARRTCGQSRRTQNADKVHDVLGQQSSRR